MVTRGRLERIKRALNFRQPDLVLVVDNVRSPHNFSALLRTAEAMAFLEVHAIVPERKVSLVQKGITQGAYRWLEINAWNSPEEILPSLKGRGLRVVVTALDEEAKDFREVDYTVPVAIVVGNEAEGVSEKTLSMADDVIKIPMYGMVQSLNVSVAFGMIAREAINQRERKGMLGKVRLSPEKYSQLMLKYLKETETIASVAERVVSTVRKTFDPFFKKRPVWVIGLYAPSKDVLNFLDASLSPFYARRFDEGEYVFYAIPHIRKHYSTVLEEIASSAMSKSFLIFFKRFD